MTKGRSKEVAEILEFCRSQEGVRVKEGTKHWIVFPADREQRPVIVPNTPSDWRSLENVRSALRRAGIPIPHRGGR